ncbi:MAG TPA: hypothetical protein VEG08_11255 [Terriglobales bacterium]|nr:hypothetical protein [Terriglobales bacterium]
MSPRKGNDSFGLRPNQLPGARQVSRCAQCGVVLPALGDLPAQCPKCAAALHSCQQCTHFDPSERFECRQPVPERVTPKDAANACTFYEIRVSVERETTTGISSAGRTPADARKAFDDLFKK